MKRFNLLFISFLVTVSVFAQQQLYQRVKVYADDDQLVQMARSGIDITEGTLKKGHFMIADLSVNEIDAVREMGIDYEVMIEDVSKYYVDRNKGKSFNVNDYKGISEWPVPENFDFGSMSGHATWDEIVDHLENMADLYPDLITQKESIGQSGEGRDLWMVKISDNPTVNEEEPEVLYTALHHAREPAGVMTLLYYMYYLLENYDTDPFIQTLVDNTEMYFVPVLNPDGYVFNQQTNPNGGGMWRKNRRDNGVTGCRGVDINRNYGYQWGYDNYGSSPDPCDETYRGPAAFSEPEIAAVRDFCEAHEFKNALNYHTFSNLLLYAWGWTDEPSEDDDLFFAHASLYTMDNNYTFGPGSTTIYPTNGGSDDWMYGEQSAKPKTLAYTPELGGDNDGFWCAIDRIVPIAQENMIQNILAAAFAGKYADVGDKSPLVLNEQEGFVSFDIMRLGLMDGATFTVGLEGLGPAIINTGEPVEFPGMELLELATDSISYTLHPDIISGTPLQFVLSVDNGDFVLYDTIHKIFGEPVVLFEDDGNSLNNWITPNWGITSASYFSPPSSITDSPFGNYQNYQTSAVILDGEVDLSDLGFALLTFEAKWEIEQGWDYVQCEISANGGSSWTPLEGKFTGIGNENQATGEPLYDGFQTSWVKEEINLSDYLGSEVTFRFLLKTDQAVTEDGFYFDDFTVLGVENSTVGLDENLQKIPVFVSEPMPNPAKGNVSFDVLVDQSTDMQFSIYSVTGRSLYTEKLKQGSNRIDVSTDEWEPGIYFYRTESKTQSTVMKKLILL
ncbi:MAG: immune inhibitor A [Bacteroidales bacterium]|nr:immune inhibitor A [Bacteroidales bacterium]